MQRSVRSWFLMITYKWWPGAEPWEAPASYCWSGQLRWQNTRIQASAKNILLLDFTSSRLKPGRAGEKSNPTSISINTVSIKCGDQPNCFKIIISRLDFTFFVWNVTGITDSVTHLSAASFFILTLTVPDQEFSVEDVDDEVDHDVGQQLLK